MKSKNPAHFRERDFGGDEEDRTLDLTDPTRTLSQLSYAPTNAVIRPPLYSTTTVWNFQVFFAIFTSFFL